MIYQWLVFLHVLGAVTFIFAHGVSAAVALKLRGERQMDRVLVLLELSRSWLNVAGIGLLIILASGIIGGFMGNWWGQGWIWVSLGLVLALWAVMFIMGTLYFGKIRKAVGLPYAEGMKYDNPPVAPVSQQELESLLSSLSSRPIVLLVIGVGGLGIILWLMMFKPF